IADARLLLDEARGEPAQLSAVAPADRNTRERWLWIAAVLVLIMVLAANTSYFRPGNIEAPEMRLEIATPSPTAGAGQFALLPDGRKLVLEGQRKRWLGPLEAE